MGASESADPSTLAPSALDAAPGDTVPALGTVEPVAAPEEPVTAPDLASASTGDPVQVREVAAAYLAERGAGKRGSSYSRLRSVIGQVVELIEASGLPAYALPSNFLAAGWEGRYNGTDALSKAIRARIALDFLSYLGAPPQEKPSIDSAALDALRVRQKQKRRVARELARQAAEEAGPEVEVEDEEKPMPTAIKTARANGTAPRVDVPGTATSSGVVPVAPVMPDPVLPSQTTRGRRDPGMQTPVQAAQAVQAMIPPNCRVRVWKHGAPGEPLLYVKDFPAPVVQRHGSIEGFLDAVVRPNYGPFPGQGDLTYAVAYVNHLGQVGKPVDYPVAAALFGPGSSLPGGLPGGLAGSAMPGSLGGLPVGYGTYGGLPAAAPTLSDGYAFYDQMRVSEEHTRQLLAKLMAERERVGAVPLPTLDATIAELRAQQHTLQMQLLHLQNATDERHMQAQVQVAQMAQMQMPPATSETGQAAQIVQPLVALMGNMVEKAHTPAPAPPEKPPSFMEMMQLLQQTQTNSLALAKEMFARSGSDDKFTAAIDRITDKFERRMKDLEDDIEDAREHESDLDKFSNTARKLREMAGVEPNVPFLKARESEGFFAVMKDMLRDGLTQGPELMRQYRAIVRTVAAVEHGLAPPSEAEIREESAAHPRLDPDRAPTRALPSATPAAPPSAPVAPVQQARRPATEAEIAAAIKAKRRAVLPDDLRTAIEALFSAADEDQIIDGYNKLIECFDAQAVIEEKLIAEMRASGKVVKPSVTKRVCAQVKELVIARNSEALVPTLVGIMDYVGYGTEATLARVQTIVGVLLETAAEDEDAEEAAVAPAPGAEPVVAELATEEVHAGTSPVPAIEPVTKPDAAPAPEITT